MVEPVLRHLSKVTHLFEKRMRHVNEVESGVFAGIDKLKLWFMVTFKRACDVTRFGLRHWLFPSDANRVAHSCPAVCWIRGFTSPVICNDNAGHSLFKRQLARDSCEFVASIRGR